MSRAELWRALDEATDAVQTANDAFGQTLSPQTRAALTAAFHAYAECLSPLIGHAAALRYEAGWMTYHAAIGTKNEAAAWDVFEGGRVPSARCWRTRRLATTSSQGSARLRCHHQPLERTVALTRSVFGCGRRPERLLVGSIGRRCRARQPVRYMPTRVLRRSSRMVSRHTSPILPIRSRRPTSRKPHALCRTRLETTRSNDFASKGGLPVSR